MAQVRKTRQQKINISQRRSERLESHYDALVTKAASTDAVSVESGRTVTAQLDTNISPFDAQTQATQAYVAAELRRIAWVSLLCLGLLAVASLLISDLPWLDSARQTLHLPQLFASN